MAAVGDAEDPATWSGIPYHFLLAARRAGLADAGLRLLPAGAAWRLRRAAWNLTRPLTGDRLGGYQYTVGFLERLWSPERARAARAIVVNCFQLYPPSIVADPSIERWFYVDMTLVQLLDHYGLARTIGRRIARDALRREGEGYRAAAGVVAHSRWAARSVLADHGVDPSRVHVALPGANLDPEAYARWEALASPDAAGPPRLVFVGKDWRRKGLDRLLAGFALARARGLRASLRVIGCPRESLPADLASIEGVEWLGFIDKRREAGRFLAAVAECDVGCLLSRAEAGGIALREYHALGLAVLGTEAGGAPEHAIPEASKLVPVAADAEAIARSLLELEVDRPRLRRSARELRRSATWEATIDRFRAFWPHALPVGTPCR